MNQPTSQFNGHNNVAVGNNTLRNNTIGTNNIGIGNNTLLFNTEGSYNTAIGSHALHANTIGVENTAIGNNALFSNLIGQQNTASGKFSLQFNTDGNFNTAYGHSSLYYNKANSRSTAIGYQAMWYADDRIIGRETYNTAIGTYALYGSNIAANNTGQNNTAVGDDALRSNANGNQNTAVGSRALYNNSNGEYNTVLGMRALTSNVSGSNNVAIGIDAGYSNISGSGNVFLGFQAGYTATADNLLVIENSNAVRALIRGDFSGDKVGINRTKTEIDFRGETFQVQGEAFKTSGTGDWIIPSDRRLKENIVYLDAQEALNKVLKMKGVNYNWIDRARGNDKVFGFIAQDLQQIFPENVKTDKEGYLSTSYGTYDPLIIESIKALKSLIDEQRNMIDLQNKKISALESSLPKLNN